MRRIILAASGAVALAALPIDHPAGAQGDPAVAPSPDTPSPMDGGSADPDDSSAWRFDGAFYAWLPGVFGRIEAHGRSAPIDLTVGDMIDLLFNQWRALDAGAHFEAHYDRFDLLVDAIGGYVKPSTSATVERLGQTVRFDARATVHFVLAEFGLGYRVGEWSIAGRRRPMSLGLLAGARYYHIGNDITATRAVPISERELSAESVLNWADPFIGVRWEIPVLDSLAWDFRSDIGGFGAGSDLSYSLVSSFRWWLPTSWRTQPWLGLGYKLVAFDYEVSGESGINTQLRGPWLGAGIDF